MKTKKTYFERDSIHHYNKVTTHRRFLQTHHYYCRKGRLSGKNFLHQRSLFQSTNNGTSGSKVIQKFMKIGKKNLMVWKMFFFEIDKLGVFRTRKTWLFLLVKQDCNLFYNQKVSTLYKVQIFPRDRIEILYYTLGLKV